MRTRIEYGAALLVLVIGAAAVLLLATRTWQTITTPRPRPFRDDVLQLSGRALDTAPTALALVALAGSVAVIATKGLLRKLIGVLLAFAGAALIWRCVAALPAVDTVDARSLVHDLHPHVVPSGAVTPHVTTHPIWGVLSVVADVLVVVAGLLIATRGGRWAAMSTRYERHAEDPQHSRARADAALWGALERGEDPTTRDPREAS